jgi:hypothetical protein
MRAKALRKRKNFNGRNSALRTMKGRARIAKPPKRYFKPVRRTAEMPGRFCCFSSEMWKV